MKRYIGFTGTRHGMTERQKEEVDFILRNRGRALSHGDCVGADSDAHDIAVAAGVLTVAHPPTDDKLRAFREADMVLRKAPYHERNRDIVDAADVLVATPAESEEQVKGGTWYTVRYARATKTLIIIVWPNGSVRIEETL